MSKIWSFRCKSCGLHSPYNEYRLPPARNDGKVRPERLLAICPKCAKPEHYLYDDLELMEPYPTEAAVIAEAQLPIRSAGEA